MYIKNNMTDTEGFALDTARIAMPILVWLMSITSANTSAITKNGVTSVTTLVVAGPMLTESEINGIVGYCCARPPVI